MVDYESLIFDPIPSIHRHRLGSGALAFDVPFAIQGLGVGRLLSTHCFWFGATEI